MVLRQILQAKVHRHYESKRINRARVADRSRRTIVLHSNEVLQCRLYMVCSELKQDEKRVQKRNAVCETQSIGLA